VSAGLPQQVAANDKQFLFRKRFLNKKETQKYSGAS
jgi:hypothetical protein